MQTTNHNLFLTYKNVAKEKGQINLPDASTKEKIIPMQAVPIIRRWN